MALCVCPCNLVRITCTNLLNFHSRALVITGSRVGLVDNPRPRSSIKLRTVSVIHNHIPTLRHKSAIIIEETYCPHACMCSNKVIGLSSLSVVVHMKIIRSGDLDIWATWKYNKSVKLRKNWHLYASNRWIRSTSVTNVNSVFLLATTATPINNVY